jgi:DNA-binding HxlR family transcriptional regulator
LSSVRGRLGASQLAYQSDPIRESLNLLGRKWTLLIIRDIAFLKLRRFGEILKNNPGLTPRVLSRRLEEMTREGLLKKKGSEIRLTVSGRKVGNSGYYLTAKGEDAVYVLLAVLRYGIRHCIKENRNEKEVVKELHYDMPQGWSY